MYLAIKDVNCNLHTHVLGIQIMVIVKLVNSQVSLIVHETQAFGSNLTPELASHTFESQNLTLSNHFKIIFKSFKFN